MNVPVYGAVRHDSPHYTVSRSTANTTATLFTPHNICWYELHEIRTLSVKAGESSPYHICRQSITDRSFPRPSPILSRLRSILSHLTSSQSAWQTGLNGPLVCHLPTSQMLPVVTLYLGGLAARVKAVIKWPDRLPAIVTQQVARRVDVFGMEAEG